MSAGGTRCALVSVFAFTCLPMSSCFPRHHLAVMPHEFPVCMAVCCTVEDSHGEKCRDRRTELSIALSSTLGDS